MSNLLWVRIFTVPRIMHNYRSNQSSLMTRCEADLRHQYGIFGGKSQTSFLRNATRARREEGRLLSQARCVIAINAKVIFRFELIFLKRFFATCGFSVILQSEIFVYYEVKNTRKRSFHRLFKLI